QARVVGPVGALEEARVVLADDRLLVVRRVPNRAGDLTDRVASGVQRDRAGRVAVAGVGLLGRAVDLETEAAGVIGRRQALAHLERARHPDVREGAFDIVA